MPNIGLALMYRLWMSCEASFKTQRFIEKAIAKKEVFLFLLHKNNGKQRSTPITSSLFVSMCVGLWINMRAKVILPSHCASSPSTRACVCEGRRGWRELGELIQASNSPMTAEGHRLPQVL